MNRRRNVYHRKDEGGNIKTGLLSPIIYYPTDEELKKEKEKTNQLSKDMEKFLGTPLDYFMFECWWSSQKDYYLFYECAIYAYIEERKRHELEYLLLQSIKTRRNGLSCLRTDTTAVQPNNTVEDSI